MSQAVPKCVVCDVNPATLKITVTKMNGDYYDDTEVCHTCANDACAEMCLCLPPNPNTELPPKA
jgi:hypothetical protein